MPKSFYCLVFAAGAIAVGGFNGCRRSSASGQGAPAAVSVIAGKVMQRDTPIFLDGIGTIAAFNMVTVRTQVTGQLQKIAFVEGQDVKAGDLLAVIDPRTFQAQVDQAKGKKAQDEAQLSNAQVTYQRNNTLLQKGMVDQQTVDTEKAAVDQFQAAVQADQASIEQAEAELSYTQITAPISGRIGIRQVDAGNIVQPSDANGLVVITQLKPISAIFTLPQQDWSQIQRLLAEGQTLTTLAFDRDSRTPLDRGVLSVVDNQIDATTGTIKLKATFPNDDLVLWPGQFVNVRLRVETRKDGIVVPASVIQRGPDGAYAFVIKADSTVAIQPVQVAQIDGGLALIDQGLKPGEQVVVDGQYKLQTGSVVTATVAPGADASAGHHRRSKPSE
jgi:multidrug efflux system membrane fusion protein